MGTAQQGHEHINSTKGIPTAEFGETCDSNCSRGEVVGYPADTGATRSWDVAELIIDKPNSENYTH